MKGGPIFIGGLITESPMMIGGSTLSLDSFNSIMSHFSGFDGCIQGMVIGDRKINFEEDSIITANVKPCGLE